MKYDYRYADYQKECAYYGFTDTPLTGSQFKELCVATHNDYELIFSLGCDVACGVSFSECLELVESYEQD